MLFRSLLGALEHPAALAPPERVELAVQTLELIAADEGWRNSREVVRSAGEAFADAVRAAYGCSPREWTRRIRPAKVALDSEGHAAVGVGVALGSAVERPDERLVVLVRRGVNLLRCGYRVDVPLEDLYADAALVLVSHELRAVLESESESGSGRWLVTILRSLVAARHPRLALALLSAVPSSELTLDQVNALLRTHHLATSSATFSLLVAHPTLSLSRESIHSRLIGIGSSPSPSHSLPLAHAALLSLPLPRCTKTWNLLLSLTARAGSSRALLRTARRMHQAGVPKDQHTFNILLASHTRPGRRTVGPAQIRAVVSQLGNDHDKVGANILLRALARSSVEINATHLVSLARTVLGVDLARPLIDQHADAFCPTRQQWQVERKPAYATLEKAFRMRGESDMRAALVRARVLEERRLRWAERAERAERDDLGKDVQP